MILDVDASGLRETKQIFMSIKGYRYNQGDCVHKTFLEKYDCFACDIGIMELATLHNCQKFVSRAIEKKIKLNQTCLV